MSAVSSSSAKGFSCSGYSTTSQLLSAGSTLLLGVCVGRRFVVLGLGSCGGASAAAGGIEDNDMRGGGGRGGGGFAMFAFSNDSYDSKAVPEHLPGRCPPAPCSACAQNTPACHCQCGRCPGTAVGRTGCSAYSAGARLSRPGSPALRTVRPSCTSRSWAGAGTDRRQCQSRAAEGRPGRLCRSPSGRT